LAAMTKVYQDKIRNSPLWAEMVELYGQEGAEQVLKQFRVELR